MLFVYHAFLALSCHPGSREAGWLVLELALLVSAITSLLRRPVGPRREGAYGDRAFGHPVGHLLGFRRTRPLGRSVRGASGRRGGGVDRGRGSGAPSVLPLHGSVWA